MQLITTRTNLQMKVNDNYKFASLIARHTSHMATYYTQIAGVQFHILGLYGRRGGGLDHPPSLLEL